MVDLNFSLFSCAFVYSEIKPTKRIMSSFIGKALSCISWIKVLKDSLFPWQSA